MSTVTITEATRGLAEPTGRRQLIQIITPGWGSSGYYSEALLKQAAADRVFPAGTGMYMDHATLSEQADRVHGERSVKDLAARFTQDARWDEARKALVAEAEVFGPWRPVLADMHRHIGVSIRARGTAEPGEAEGRTGLIVNSLTHVESVDFVADAGRGGQILALLESNDLWDELRVAESTTDRKEPTVGDTTTTQGAPPDEGTTQPATVTEAQTRVEQLERALAEARAELETRSNHAVRADRAERSLADAQRDIARLRGAEHARSAAAAALAESELPEAARARVTAAVVGHEGSAVPLTEAGTVDQDRLRAAIDAAIKSETAYIASISEAAGFGAPRGLGDTQGVEPGEFEGEFARLMEAAGLSEKDAKTAAKGRHA